MSNISHRLKFEHLYTQIWQRRRVDEKGRVTLPKKLRLKLGVSKGSEILWISAKQKQDRYNEYVIELGVKR